MFNKSYPIKVYFNKVSNYLLKKLDQYPIDQLCKYSDDEINDIFIDNLKIEKVEFDHNNKHKSMVKTKIKQDNNTYNSRNRGINDCVFEDAFELTVSIPVVSGDINFLIYHPNTEIIFVNGHSNAKYRINDITNCVEVTFNIMKSIFVNKTSASINEYVNNEFSKQAYELFTLTNKLNSEIEEFNNNLLSFAKKYIESRKKEQDFTNMIIQSTGIELKEVTQPAQEEMKTDLESRIKKEQLQFPKEKNKIVESNLDDNMYKSIMKCIYSFLSNSESNPQTMDKLGEEDIRNTILWNLNTNLFKATGETFRKNGKTDICIQFNDNKVFIAECKIWKGEKSLLSAINQLDGYSTWRDDKVAILFFNKDKVNFDDAINSFKEAIKKHIRFLNIKEIKKNYFECEFKNNLGNNPVLISFIISNFFIDKSLKKN